MNANNTRFESSHAGVSHTRVIFAADARLERRYGGFRMSWSSCPAHTYLNSHCSEGNIPRDAGAGVFNGCV